MGFLKRVMKTTFRDGHQSKAHSSFEDVSETQLEQHLSIARYGSFLLTDAVRPSFNLEVVPSAGCRRDVYRDAETSIDVPVLMVAQTRERLFDLFINLLDPLGDEVDVVLETSHEAEGGAHQDLYREHIDLPILKSTLYDYEDLLLNDGCTGIAVLNPAVPVEVQFDEHKLLIVYGNDLSQFEEILSGREVDCDDKMKFITEAEHVHSSSDVYSRQFDELKTRLGMDCHFAAGGGAYQT